MGRIILTNNQTWSNKLENNFFNLLGLTKTGDIENTIRLKVYQKKKVKNENFYKTTDGIIATNGTIFYKELINEEALKEILKDFKELLKKYDISECITKLRKNMIGSFSIFIKLENLAILFVDETAMYPLYYYHNKDYYLITNTYYNINECTNTECDILPLLEKGICSTIVGNKTPFKNIKRLQEDEYILLENNNLKLKNVKVNKYEYKYENYYEAFEILKKEIEKIGRIRAKKKKKHYYLLLVDLIQEWN